MPTPHPHPEAHSPGKEEQKRHWQGWRGMSSVHPTFPVGEGRRGVGGMEMHCLQ